MRRLALLSFGVTLLMLGGCGGGGGSSGGGEGDSNGVTSVIGPPLTVRPDNPTCVAAARPSVGSVDLTQAFPSLDPNTNRKTGLRQIPGVDSHWYLADLDGRILRFDNDTNVSSATVVLDIRDRVAIGGERGLLGFAFSPDFATDGTLYVSYTTATDSRISAFTSADGGLVFDSDLGAETVIFEHVQEADNHNGGDLHFGPDGHLYLSLGDDGTRALAQDLGDVRGSILRIDPSGNDGLPTNDRHTVRNYAIPNDNPFVGQAGATPEIYAYGFRNPWRFTVDMPTGDVWVGDVGYLSLEEIDLVVPGGNYGWPHKEGTLCFDTTPCEDAEWLDPVVEYGHDEGLSVIAAHVYRGSAVPDLVGKMIFSEWSDGVVWAASFDAYTGEGVRVEIGDMDLNYSVVAWGLGNDGELYAATGGFPTIEAGSGDTGQAFPQSLSDTGCVLPSDATVMVDGLIPYNVNLPLWSDDATKRRWFALPDGDQITVEASGHWTLPVGSVLVKEFWVDDQRAETRLMMRHDDGNWAGYSYRWNDDGMGATLVLGGSTFDTGIRHWAIPSASQCLQCHTDVSGQTLGWETAQLNRDYIYEGAGEVNQLEAFETLGLLAAPPGVPGNLPALSPLDSVAPLETRAREYLHVQCAQCHQPGGTNETFDARWTTSFADSNLCDTAPQYGDLGVTGARLVAPGDASASIISLRMQATDSNRMPRIGTVRVHDQAVEVVDAWLDSLVACP